MTRNGGKQDMQNAVGVDANATTHEAHMPQLPVAGLVASAGGLEAFKRFFKAMPTDSGIAFVLIPHLDPRHESLMAPLLARHTGMVVLQAADGQRLQANHVYVIPPDRYLSLQDGVIRLSHPPDDSPGENAIDPFLRSLANDQQERAIGIVLSGTGGHGALGLKAIKAAGGMTMVQEPASAEYDGMPRSAIDTGLADCVMTPEDMPAELIRYLQQFLFTTAAVPELAAVQDSLTQMLVLLKAHSRFDFRAYRKHMLLRRIQRRVGLTHRENFADYLALLREQPGELDLLSKDLLISISSFFRDPAMYRMLQTRILPELIERRDAGNPLRVWVAGCATGEEAYSIAMLLIELLDAAGKDCPLQVFATDVDDSALKTARLGIYPQAQLADVDRHRLARFFTRIDSTRWQVKKPLREAVLFASQNLLADAPFSKLDLVSCRNMLVYLQAQVQQQLLELFHYSLNDNGYLILAPSESITEQVDLYQPVSKKWRIFQRARDSHPVRARFPVQVAERNGDQHLNTQLEHRQQRGLTEQVHKALLQDHAPAAVVIDRHYQVMHYSGSTCLYLQLPNGEPSRDLLSMAHPGLRSGIRSTLKLALQKAQKVDSEDNRIQRDGSDVVVRISAQPLPVRDAAEELFLFTFRDQELQIGHETGRHHDTVVDSESPRTALEYELKTTREELHSIIEEQQSNNEELMAASEENRAMIEELQSANEELEASREELQSLNEELGSVNAELQDKVEELDKTSNDLANLIDSADTAIVFLDTDCSIQRFTPGASDLFRLIDVDLGRHIKDISRRFEDAQLMRDIDRVLTDLTPLTSEVPGENERWYLRRITPYLGSADRIEGVVLAFTDITAVKRAQLELREMTETLEQRVEERNREFRQEHDFNDVVLNTVPSLVLVIDRQKRVVRFNRACEIVTGYHFKELVGTTDWWQLIPASQQPSVQQVVERLLAGEEPVSHENHWLTRDGATRLLSWSNTLLKDQHGEVQCIIGAGLDITEQRNAEMKARRHLEEASRLQRVQTANELATVLAHEINQPLAAIAMYADSGRKLLGHSPLQSDKLDSLLAQVSEQALRGGDIIRRMRKFVRRGKIELVATDLNAIVHRVCAQLGIKAKTTIDLIIDTEASLPRVMADELHIEQVLLNLLRNAIEAILDGGNTSGTITVSTGREQDQALVSIRDSGPGIDDLAASALFEPLATSKEYGLGVGLRISRSLIEAHGGRLWAEPHVPGGIFHFTLEFAS